MLQPETRNPKPEITRTICLLTGGLGSAGACSGFAVECVSACLVLRVWQASLYIEITVPYTSKPHDPKPEAVCQPSVLLQAGLAVQELVEVLNLPQVQPPLACLI